MEQCRIIIIIANVHSQKNLNNFAHIHVYLYVHVDVYTAQHHNV